MLGVDKDTVFIISTHVGPVGGLILVLGGGGEIACAGREGERNIQQGALLIEWLAIQGVWAAPQNFYEFSEIIFGHFGDVARGVMNIITPHDFSVVKAPIQSQNTVQSQSTIYKILGPAQTPWIASINDYT